MITITGIRPTKRGRMALFGPEGFMFSVDAETLALAGIETGSQLGEGELEQLRAQSETRKAKDAALRYLSLRAYGEKELYQKLLQRYDEHSAAAAVAKMCELELLDDGLFATEKAKGMLERGKSPREIERKLLALGIAPALVQSAVAGLDFDGEAAALELVLKRYTDKLQNGKRQNVMAALARRGFGHREIQSAVKAAEEQLQINGVKEEQDF